MSDRLLIVVFLACAVVSLGASWVLVSRLERVGARLGISEALLGALAALAADAPELTAAVTAIVGHQSRLGAGVVLGSNVFNLAALLGLAAVIAGGVALHRRVVVLEGVVALWVAAVCLVVVIGPVSPAAGLGLAIAVLGPYLLVLGMRRSRLRRLRLPGRWVSWLTTAIVDEEIELGPAIHPRRGHRRNAIVASVAVLVVVGASVAMEQAVSKLGRRHAIPQIVVGGLILAAVTSLPNAVAGGYLARRGRGAATLSTAMNSNALNVALGLLLPGAILGLGASSGPVTTAAAWYLALTAFLLVSAYLRRGLQREHGVLIICAYLAFAGVLVSTAYSSTLGQVLSVAVPALAAVPAAARLAWNFKRRGGPPPGEGDQEPPDPARAEAFTDGRQPEPVDDRQDQEQSLVVGWSIPRVFYLALGLTTCIAAIDAILGRHVILIGLLIAGPCCGLLTGRWAKTAAASGWAVALAVLLGIPDRIWGTYTHLVFLAAVVVVALVSTSSAALVESRR